MGIKRLKIHHGIRELQRKINWYIYGPRCIKFISTNIYCISSIQCVLTSYNQDCVSLLWWTLTCINAFYPAVNTGPGGPPNGPALFCSLASVVVCRLSSSLTLPAGAPAAGRMGGRTADMHGGPVLLRPVRARPCFTCAPSCSKP